MKLELKHIAPYLPYGVGFISEIDKPYEEFGKQPKWTLDGITTLFGDYCLIPKETNDAYAIQTCKLILRPLSYLTKEIEVNGERFVPIVELAKISNLNLKHELIDSISIEEDVAVLKYGALQFGFDLTDMSFITCLGEEIVPAYNQLQLFERLFSWHFDVFGLIENGLAIDINTLEK